MQRWTYLFHLVGWTAPIFAAQWILVRPILRQNLREVMLASDLATVSPRQVFAREIASGELVAIPIVRPKILQTTWMSLGASHSASSAAEIVARLIRQLAARWRATR